MRIVMIGSGSIGMLVSFYLTKKGHSISMLTNQKEQAQALNEEGLHLILQNDKRERVRISAEAFRNIQSSDSIDIVIVAVKSYQVKGVLERLRELHINISAILFLQNGMAHTELIPELEILEVAVAVVEHGAMRKNHYTVQHTGVGKLKWSYVREGNGRIKDLLTHSSQLRFDIAYVDHWNRMLEQKLIINACVNPLTALMEVKNGELLTNGFCYSMMNSVFEEVRMILNLANGDEEWKHVKDVCARTANNESSMLLDLKYNRPTEIDSIIGYLIRRAEEQNQEVTILPFLLQAILAKEKVKMGEEKIE